MRGRAGPPRGVGRLQARASRSGCAPTAPTVEKLAARTRPLVSVFLPDRLELVLGAPALRRSHLDQVVAALWPARAGTRRAYAAALAQRNALLASIRAGRASRASLPAWDAELARHGVALMADRAATVERLRPRFAEHAAGLGLEGEVDLRYRPRATDEPGRGARRAPRLRPRARLHRPRPAPRRPRLPPRAPRAARVRLARPAAARAAGAAARRARGAGRRARRRPAAAARRRDVRARRHAPRAARRSCCAATARPSITTTELAHVPGAEEPDVTRIAVTDGRASATTRQGLASLEDAA